jgi:hypothetical protein
LENITPEEQQDLITKHKEGWEFRKASKFVQQAAQDIHTFISSLTVEQFTKLYGDRFSFVSYEKVNEVVVNLTFSVEFCKSV